MQREPFKILQLDESFWPEDFDPCNEILRTFDASSLPKLRELLESDNSLIARRGLFLFGELGRKAQSLTDSAVRLFNHESVYARSHLLDGLLCFPSKLTSEQIAMILPLTKDRSEIVRSKMLVILACVPIDLLAAAIDQLAVPNDRDRHLFCFQLFQRHFEEVVRRQETAQAILDTSIRSGLMEEVYMQAALIKAADTMKMSDIPEPQSGSYVAKNTVFQIRRRIRRKYRLSIREFDPADF